MAPNSTLLSRAAHTVLMMCSVRGLACSICSQQFLPVDQALLLTQLPCRLQSNSARPEHSCFFAAMLDSSRLLFSLAEQFISQQAYQQAVKCLTPICSQSSELPSVVALARLQLASLLLEHFDNFQEAKAILLTAVGARQRLPACTAAVRRCRRRHGVLRAALSISSTWPPLPPLPVFYCRRTSCGRRRAITSSNVRCGTSWRAATSSWVLWRQSRRRWPRASRPAARAPHPRTSEPFCRIFDCSCSCFANSNRAASVDPYARCPSALGWHANRMCCVAFLLRTHICRTHATAAAAAVRSWPAGVPTSTSSWQSTA